MTWLVTGAGGQLGSVLLLELVSRGERALGVASPRGPMPASPCMVERADITDSEALARLLDRAGVRFVVHAAAISSVAAALSDPERAMAVNATAAGALARLAYERSVRFVHVSTDMVFEGERAPYAEGDAPSPLSTYGRSKLEGERAVSAAGPALVARLPLLYGVPAVRRTTTFLAQVRALRRGEPLDLFHDEWRTPLCLTDAARALIRCAESDLAGIVHLGGPERLSRFEMGQRLAAALGVDPARVRAVSQKASPAPEPRARDLALDSTAYCTRFGEAEGVGVGVGRPMAEALAAMDLASA